MTNYIAYLRVSTKTQHNGIEAQQNAINAFLASYGGSLIDTYSEQVSGAKDEREELNKALKACKRHNAVLLVSKLDRLSRKVSFIAQLMESSIQLKVAELPQADTFQLHIYSALAEQERKLISDRTKQALAVRKSQGVKLGSPLNEKRSTDAREFAEKIVPVIDDLKSQGYKSLRQIASRLNEIGYNSFSGGKWHPQSVKNTLGYIS